MMGWLTALWLLLAPAQAADWTWIQATEPDGVAGHLRPWGFLQTTLEGVVAQPVEGLTSPELAPYNGEVAAFNRVGPFQQRVAFSLRRARMGLRGVVPGTQGLVSTFAAVELGMLPLTLANGVWRPALTDASVSLHSPWRVSLRVGRMKAPLADETLESVALTAATLTYSLPVRRLLAERNTASGTPTGTVSGFRDDGALLVGAHPVGAIELSWALMVGQGGTLQGPGDAGWDVTSRLQLSWLLDDAPRSPVREELSMWGFVQTGRRRVGPGALFPRHRAGAGAQLRHGRLRLRSEFLWGQGVLNTGKAPPFPGGELTVSETGRAWGLTALAVVSIQPMELGVAYAHYASRPQEGPAHRRFHEVTGTARWTPHPAVGLQLNAAWRQGRAPDGPPDAQTVLDTYGVYLGAELTLRLKVKPKGRSGTQGDHSTAR